MNLLLRFDGGCRGNPGAMYGSYEARINGKDFFKSLRFELGQGTNNEAEFKALHRGLLMLVKSVPETMHGHYDLKVVTDSMIVRNRLMGKNLIHKKPAWRSRSEVMYALANECLEELRKFKSFTVEWQGREQNVKAFGH